MTYTDAPAAAGRLRAAEIAAGYAGRDVLTGFTATIPDHAFTVIVGPNACGKSTLLRALAGSLPVTSGVITLDHQPLARRGPKQLATQIALLPQSATAPEGITVAELAARGRHPHQSLLRQWSHRDETAVIEALEATGMLQLASARVDTLSGGQRQRVWVAMALAQQTPILLLDEPTTFLDIAHQLDLLWLCTSLVRTQQRTIVAVLHDLNQAFRYADHLIVIRDGKNVAQGRPAQIVTPGLIRDVFDVRARVVADPESRTPMMVPLADAPTEPAKDEPAAADTA